MSDVLKHVSVGLPMSSGVFLNIDFYITKIYKKCTVNNDGVAVVV